MERQDLPKARRPLPNPHPNQGPSTPVQTNVPGTVSPANFYGAKSTAVATPHNSPALPRRSRQGSGHTTFLPPSSPPPIYNANEPTPFREPELVAVTEEQRGRTSGQGWYDAPDPWGTDTSSGWGEPKSNWVTNWTNPSSSWYGGHNSFDHENRFSSRTVPIDGRVLYEEDQWWNKEVREKNRRPGPGLLPPLMAEMLHDPDHSLFSVTATPPEPNFSVPPPDSSPTGPSSEASSSLSPPPSSSSRRHSASFTPPTPEEVRTTIPHPNAYFCPKENGWVLLIWKSSKVLPPLASSFTQSLQSPLPDQYRRQQVKSCIAEAENSYGRTNKTHHFHLYEKAVDATKLNPPFNRAGWHKEEVLKRQRRGASINMGDVDFATLKNFEEEVEVINEGGDLLDLFVCCQCSVYCISSGVIPGVIPRKYLDAFLKDRKEHPKPGKTGETTVLKALELFAKIFEDKIWANERRHLPVMRPSFQSAFGWGTTIQKIFSTLGYVSVSMEGDELQLLPPNTDASTQDGAINRSRWLRAWVEVCARIQYQRQIAKSSALEEYKPRNVTVKISSVREMYQSGVGAHPDQIPRGLIPESMIDHPAVAKSWKVLGMSQNAYSWDLLAFAYFAQCRCDPARTPDYFTHLFNIVRTLEELGDVSPGLQTVVVDERSRSRFTYDDIESAAQVLEFGTDRELGVEYDSDVDDDFIAAAWKNCVKSSWKDPVRGPAKQRNANDALKILAEVRGSVQLRELWETKKGFAMSPDKAYDTLEVPKEVEEDMLLMIFNMRIEEHPPQLEKMREALAVISEARDSSRLRIFLETGTDPNTIVASTRADLPRGLNQLGNTCYLNSLLQYFYTIKDVRDAVTPMGSQDLKLFDEEKLSEDELKKHRVGGRLVTRREIIRSRRFISQLADLFYQMEYADTAAVTPSIELAKLALVTSRDEEEEEADKGGTETSNDTDATLVEDGRAVTQVDSSSHSPILASGSVLGKRPRHLGKQQSAMEVDTSEDVDKEGFVLISRTPATAECSDGASSSKIGEPSVGKDKDGDVEMATSQTQEMEPKPKPPPLPARKLAPHSDSVMMFGKQHDVAECMDNCMFQIETALLKFESMSNPEDTDKTSVVKRLFYGKLRQRVSLLSEQQTSRSSIHEKEDLFSHLPVNVVDDGVDIYDGLSRYFDDVVDFEGKKARMEVSLIDLPPLLQIQLQRVQFNRETLQAYKSQAYVKFGETVYMDRFLDSVDPQRKAHAKEIQAELDYLRERLRELTTGKNAPFTAVLSNTRDFLTKQVELSPEDLDEELVFQLQEEETLIQSEVDELRGQIDRRKEDLEAIWRDSREAAYELTSVFIHRGSSPSWGHYFFYSRHLPGNPNSWFKYNDSEVTVVTKEEVLANTTGQTANPYLLVFARQGSEVVDTVKRFDAMVLDNS